MQTEKYIRRLFNVDRDTISKWRYHFSEFLSDSATTKCETRHYTESDIRVFALISEYWENDPDYENIHTMLACGDQNDERYWEIVYSTTPVFKEIIPGEVNALNQGVILDSRIMSDPLEIAKAYKHTGDILIDEVFRYDESPWELGLAYTIFYTYRHALELYLKKLIDYVHDPTDIAPHSLLRLLERFCKMIEPQEINPWVLNFLKKFDEIDQKGTSFRYAEAMPDHILEWWIDFRHLRTAVNILCKNFDKYLQQKNIL